MRTHIDWLTFTMTMEYPDDTFDGYTSAINGAFIRMFTAETYLLAMGGEWGKRPRSRAPYTDAWELLDGGVVVFASPSLPHCCVEISGQGCERLIQLGLLQEILSACADRVTRIDIACDIETEVMPDDFVSQVIHERMRTSGYQKSDTGETAYVGSQKSDRYARVYRYFKPHPRSHLLRVEHVFRREYAKRVALACGESGVDDVAQASGSVFGWSHAVWAPQGGNNADITAYAGSQRGGNTVFWLIKACAPAFKRMVKEGKITDPAEFINRYFLDIYA